MAAQVAINIFLLALLTVLSQTGELLLSFDCSQLKSLQILLQFYLRSELGSCGSSQRVCSRVELYG